MLRHPEEMIREAASPEVGLVNRRRSEEHARARGRLESKRVQQQGAASTL